VLAADEANDKISLITALALEIVTVGDETA
jgi:hypothetical protein